jgi:hypothetical protein
MKNATHFRSFLPSESSKILRDQTILNEHPLAKPLSTKNPKKITQDQSKTKNRNSKKILKFALFPHSSNLNKILLPIVVVYANFLLKVYAPVFMLTNK